MDTSEERLRPRTRPSPRLHTESNKLPPSMHTIFVAFALLSLLSRCAWPIGSLGQDIAASRMLHNDIEQLI